MMMMIYSQMLVFIGEEINFIVFRFARIVIGTSIRYTRDEHVNYYIIIINTL